MNEYLHASPDLLKKFSHLSHEYIYIYIYVCVCEGCLCV